MKWTVAIDDNKLPQNERRFAVVCKTFHKLNMLGLKPDGTPLDHCPRLVDAVKEKTKKRTLTEIAREEFGIEYLEACKISHRMRARVKAIGIPTIEEELSSPCHARAA